MPKISLDTMEATNRTGYPMPYAADMAGRWYRSLGPAAGLTDFGASHVTLKPGGLSSQRHWHEGEDELVIMLAGEAVLIEEDGETPLRAGDVVAFPKGAANGHHIANRSAQDCVFVAIGRKAEGHCHYPDIDLHLVGRDGVFTHKDGTPY